MSIEKLLRDRHPLPEWVTVEELANGTGHKANGRIDVATVHCWPSKGHQRIAYEVKRTRGDFLRELQQPKKREWCEKYFHETWFVCAPGVVQSVDEIPKGWGLLVVSKKGDRLTRKKAAQYRRDAKFPETLWIAMLRNFAQKETRRFTFDGSDVTSEELDKLAAEAVEGSHRLAEDLRLKLAKELQTAKDDRQRFLAPLRHLARLMGDWQLERGFSHHRYGSEDATVDPNPIKAADITAWVEKAAQEYLSKHMQELRSARRALNRLLGDE